MTAGPNIRGMPHKRGRATKAEMAARLDAIFAIVEEIEPCGVRQAFYQTTVRGLMDKTETDYDKVQRALVKMRRDGRVPYGWIVDGTRWMYKPQSFSSLEQAVKRTAETYRRAVWDASRSGSKSGWRSRGSRARSFPSPPNSTCRCTCRADSPA